MGDILFLAHRIPFPPNRGDKIRSHNLLLALRDLAPVHVGCFADTKDDLEHEALLQDWSVTHCLVRRRRSMAEAGARALLSGHPVSLTAFDSNNLREWVGATIRGRNIQTIVVFSGQMGQFVPRGFTGRVIIDLCDVDSAKFDAYSQTSPWPRSWIDAREGRLLAAEEARLAHDVADTVLLVSDAEAELFRSRLPSAKECDIRALRNGINCDFFDPAQVDPEPALAALPGPNFVFTGQMDYAPNIAAAHRFIDKILPRIRGNYPDAMFHVVGRAPTAALLARDGEAGVRIWGEVPDVRPFLAAADVVVAPLEIARGVQNKVLEAMAMARPVVLSDGAATGIEAQDGRDFAIARNDTQFAESVRDILANPEAANAMAADARQFVLNNQSWAAMLAPLAGICGFEKESGERVVA